MGSEEKILKMLGTISDQLGRVETTQAQMQQDMSSVKLRLDLDIDRRLNLLSEANSIIVEKLKVLDEVKELAEDTRDKVDVIYAVVKQHSGDIQELKKAQ